ncbi:YkgJ family cysteine cluster protein [Sulfidibacter corallicola]
MAGDTIKARSAVERGDVRSKNGPSPDDLARLTDLNAEVTAAAAAVATVHRDRLQCRRGCSGCCVDGLTVFRIEADLIRERFADLLGAGEPGREGACAFLDAQGGCRIYEVRPYVCRTQGLPLRWLEEDEEGWLEYRDICPLNEPGPPLEELDESDCWTIGPWEGRLAELQKHVYGDRGRVRLRELFDKSSSEKAGE